MLEYRHWDSIHVMCLWRFCCKSGPRKFSSNHTYNNKHTSFSQNTMSEAIYLHVYQDSFQHQNHSFIRSISIQIIIQKSFILIKMSSILSYLNEINAPVRHPWRVILPIASFFISWYSVTHLISIMKSPAVHGM